MNFEDVIEELRILNGHTERMSAGQLDIIGITQDLIDRIDDLTNTVSDGITNDIELARNAAKTDRLNALKGAEIQPAQSSREQEAMDGLLTSLVTGIAAGAAVFYGAIAGIALAGTRFSDALTGARESTIELVAGVRGFFGTVAMMTKQFRAFSMIGGILATLPVSIPIILGDWVSRLFRRGGIVTDTISGIMKGIADFFRMLGRNILRIPGARSILASLRGAFRVITGFIGMLGRIVGFVLPFGNALSRVLGVLLRTVGRFSGVLTVVMIAVDAVRGAIDGWAETGTLMGALRGSLMGVVEGFANLFRDMGVFLDWLVTGVVNLIPFFSSEQATAAGDAVRSLFTTLGDWTMRIGQYFADITTALANFALNPTDIITELSAFVARTSSSVIEYVGSVIDGIVQAITGFLAGMIRGIANRLPDWAPGKGSLLNMANDVEYGVGGPPPTQIAPSTPTARPAEGIDMRPTERAQIVAINAPTVNQTNVQTNNRQNTVVSAPPAVRDGRWAVIR